MITAHAASTALRHLSMLLVLIYCLTGCYTSRPIFSKGDPARISTKLRSKDVNKPIRVFMKDGSVVEGKLLDFERDRLVVLESGTAQPQELPAERIDRIELKRKNYAPVALVFFVGLCYVAHEFSSGLNEAFQQMGH